MRNIVQLSTSYPKKWYCPKLPEKSALTKKKINITGIPGMPVMPVSFLRNARYQLCPFCSGKLLPDCPKPEKIISVKNPKNFDFNSPGIKVNTVRIIIIFPFLR